MRNLPILPVLACLALFCSCQKPVTDETDTSATSKVKTFKEVITRVQTGEMDSLTLNVSYDVSDRVLSMVSAAPADLRILYTYNSNNTYFLDLYNGNVLSLHEVFFINSLSFIDSTFQYNDTGDSLTEKYIYNSNRQLITLREYEYSVATGAVLDFITTYTYGSNGDLMTLADNYNSTTSYEYYPDVLKNLPFGVVFLPQPIHLVKTSHFDNNGSIESTNHTYAFDDQKRIISEKIVTVGGDFVTRYYTYQ